MKKVLIANFTQFSSMYKKYKYLIYKCNLTFSSFTRCFRFTKEKPRCNFPAVRLSVLSLRRHTKISVTFQKEQCSCEIKPADGIYGAISHYNLWHFTVEDRLTVFTLWGEKNEKWENYLWKKIILEKNIEITLKGWVDNKFFWLCTFALCSQYDYEAIYEPFKLISPLIFCRFVSVIVQLLTSWIINYQGFLHFFFSIDNILDMHSHWYMH